MSGLFAAARACLTASEPAAKVAQTQAALLALAAGELTLADVDAAPLPIGDPGRPARPRLVSPRAVPERGLGSGEGRAALVHAIAHIEFNAIKIATPVYMV